jgi:hypothetical protein
MLPAPVGIGTPVVWLLPVEEGLTSRFRKTVDSRRQRSTEEQTVQECDARNDAMKNKSRVQKITLLI